MLEDAVAALEVQPNAWYVDGTFGRGGHTAKILEAGGNVLAFDFDQEAIDYGTETFANEIESGQLILVKRKFFTPC